MSTDEKILYHQIHPLKLLTDISMGFYSVYLLWKHRAFAGLIVSIVPPIVVSLYLVNKADLEPYKRSAAGLRLARYMTRTVEALRLVGFIVMSIGAWYRRPWLIVMGLLDVVLCWTRVLLLPSKDEVASG